MRTVKSGLMAALIAIVLCCASDAAVINVSGTISSNTTWLGTDTMIVTGNVTVNSPATLTIQPGARVRFSAGTQLIINYGMVAVGDSTNHILFTSTADTAGGNPIPGSWGMLTFNAGSGTTQCRLEYCDIQFAGVGVNMQAMAIAYPIRVRHCVIQNVSSYCLQVYSSFPFIENCQLKNFTSSGVYLYGTGANLQMENTVIAQEGTFLHTGTGYKVVSSSGATQSVLSNCDIRDCESGLEVSSYSGTRSSITITNTDIHDHALYGVQFNSGSGSYYSYGTISGCNIWNNGTYNVRLTLSEPTYVLSARNNWWGTANPYSVGDKLYDFSDNNNLGMIDYTGMLDGAAPAGRPVPNVLAGLPSKDTVLDSGTIIVPGSIRVKRGANLTISPGASLRFYTNAALVVDGQLLANGTDVLPILFTSSSDTIGGIPAYQNWPGIALSDYSDSAECSLRYCTIKYASTAIQLNDSRFPYPAKISNCSINHVYQGIYVHRSIVSIDSCLVRNCSSQGIALYNYDNPIRFASEISNCTISQDTILRIGTGSGILLQYGVSAAITNCDVSRFSYGFDVYNYPSYAGGLVPTFDVKESSFHENASRGASLNTPNSAGYPCASGSFNECNFYGNISYQLWAGKCGDPLSGVGVRARNCWWGTSDPYAVGAQIFDYSDDNTAPLIDCSYPLTGSYPGGTPILGCLAGRLDADSVLTTAGSPYLLINHWYLHRSRKLTIQPGVLIYAANGTRIQVDGQLVAEGTAGSRIGFTSRRDTTGGSPVAGDWTGVILSIYSDSATSRMQYCDVKFATTGIDVDNIGSPYPSVIRQCVLSDNSTAVRFHNSQGTLDSSQIVNYSMGAYLLADQTTVQRPSINNCLFEQLSPAKFGSGTGIYIQGPMQPTIEACTIRRSSNGIYAAYSYINPNYYTCQFKIIGCTIENCNNGIYLYSASSPSVPSPSGLINNCNVTGSVQYALALDRCSDSLTSPGVDARNNYWGTTNPWQVGQSIYDATDNSGCAFVDYRNFLDAPYPSGGSVTGNYLCGRLTHDTTLTAAQSPYKVIGSWIIPQGTKVTIEPGCKFYFGPGTDLVTAGQLTAQGTPSNHIVFTSSADTVGGMPTPGTWYGLDFSDASDAQQCLLDYCDVRWANGGVDVYGSLSPYPLKVHQNDIRQTYTGIYVSGSSPIIDSCTIEDFRDYGVYITGPSSFAQILNSTIDQDTAVWVRTSGWGVYLFSEGNVKIAGTKVTDCYYGLSAYSYTGGTPPAFTAVNSEFKNNGAYGVYISTRAYNGYWMPTPRGSIAYCNLQGNGSRAIHANYCNDPTTTIQAPNNYWGVADSALIANNLIFDHHDNGYSPYVTFIPYATSANKKPCPSDFNSTGRTDYDDLAMLGFSFGSSPGADNWREVCNISNTGISNSRVDGFDLALFGSQYGIAGGCYPFTKPVVPSIPADSLRLTVTEEHNASGLHVEFQALVPQLYKVLGLCADLVVDTSVLSLEALAKDLNGQLSDNVFRFAAVEGNRVVLTVMTLDNATPIDDYLAQSIQLESRQGIEIGDNPISLENVALVLNDYVVLENPRVTYRGANSQNMPFTFALGQNYPNPFNPKTTIAFSLPEQSDVTLRIYNILGQEVRSFSLTALAPGSHTVAWDGTDISGMPLSSGVYLYRIEAGGFSSTKKAMLLK